MNTLLLEPNQNLPRLLQNLRRSQKSKWNINSLAIEWKNYRIAESNFRNHHHLNKKILKIWVQPKTHPKNHHMFLSAMLAPFVALAPYPHVEVVVISGHQRSLCRLTVHQVSLFIYVYISMLCTRVIIDFNGSF